MQAPVPPLLTTQRALRFFNLFRVASIAVLLLMTQWAMPNLALSSARLYGWMWLYAALIVLGLLLPRLRLPLSWSLSAGLCGDILLLVAFMHHYGGVASGFGMLLLPFLAVAGMLVSGRLAWFYAAVATLAVFGSVGLETLHGRTDPREWFQAALLAIACFATSSITSLLGSKARASEHLAARRAGELARLDRVNSLILQALREAVVVLDDTGSVQHFNSRAERMFGKLQRGSLLPAVGPLMRRWQQQGCPAHAQTVDLNVRGQQLLGRMVPLEESGVRLVVLFLQHVTDLAAEAQRLKLTALGRLTANMAHEIRNPLAAIRHAAELLEEDAGDDGSRRLAGMVRDNTVRINRLVQEVLQLNRRDRLVPEDIPLTPFLHELLDSFVLVTPDAANHIVLRCPDEVVVRFDRGHLQQILTNLLANGWRHGSRQPGCLVLQVTQDAISVLDDGPGVNEQAQNHLFEPFFTTASSGTGLGLYIARELAEANGGELTYQPPGGTFRLGLPVVNPARLSDNRGSAT